MSSPFGTILHRQDNPNELYQKQGGNLDKVEGPILFRPDGGRGPATPTCTPTALLGTRGEPRPN